MANCYTFVWKKSVEKNLSKVKELAREKYKEFGGEGNLTRRKLEELAVKQCSEGEEFVSGKGK